jgi:hypothetical protein
MLVWYRLSVALVLLTLCGAPAAAGLDASTPVVYVCQPGSNQCGVYSQKTKALIRLLTASGNGLADPEGVAVGAGGIWYIANTGASNVPVYGKFGSVLLKTLKDAGEYPDDVAVGNGVAAVSNLLSTTSAAGSVSVYVGRATSPSYILRDPNAFKGIGLAFDAAGNCYWSYNTASGVGQIDAFEGCSKGATPVNLGITMGFAGGVAFDARGNLWYVDQFAGLFECAGTVSCKQVAGGFSDPIYFNFTAHSKALFLADFGNNSVDRSEGMLPPGRLRPDFVVTPWLLVPGPVGVAAQPPQ